MLYTLTNSMTSTAITAPARLPYCCPAYNERDSPDVPIPMNASVRISPRSDCLDGILDPPKRSPTGKPGYSKQSENQGFEGAEFPITNSPPFVTYHRSHLPRDWEFFPPSVQMLIHCFHILHIIFGSYKFPAITPLTRRKPQPLERGQTRVLRMHLHLTRVEVRDKVLRRIVRPTGSVHRIRTLLRNTVEGLECSWEHVC